MRRAGSIRTRLTWAFLLVAAAAIGLVMLGYNLAYWSTVQNRMMGGGHMWGQQAGPLAEPQAGPLAEPQAGMGFGTGQGMGSGAGQGMHDGPGMGMGAAQGMGPGRVTAWETLAQGKTLGIQVSLIAGAVALLVAGGVSWVVADRVTRPLRRLADTARTARPGQGTFAVSPQDPDEMQELAGALNRMTDRLQEEDESRRGLFADIAHELRHPIALLRGRLEMIQDGVTPATPEVLSGLQDEVIRLGRLVDDVRELSLAEVGKLSLNLRPTDLAEEIATTQANFEPIAQSRAIILDVALEPLPALVADPDRVRQILANLLSNAVRHTPEEGRITLRAVQQGGQIAISVADTGPGIPHDEMKRIFDRFHRADPSRARATGGTGLGLAIARSLARVHGGDLTAENRPEGGALFTLILPVFATSDQGGPR